MRKKIKLHLRLSGEWPLKLIMTFIILIVLGGLQNTLHAQSRKHDDVGRLNQGNSYRERKSMESSSGLNRIMVVESDSVVVIHKVSKDLKVITASNNESIQSARIPRISIINMEALKKTASDSVTLVWKKIHTVNSKKNDD